jgi:NTE family protein
VDLNVQEKSLNELLNLKIPNHYLVIHLPARDIALQHLVLRYTDFAFYSKGEKNAFETSAKLIELNFASSPQKLQWQVGHYARVVAGKTVGVALSSGTAMAVAHFGVLQELVRNKIPIDYIAGTSGGAIFGTLFGLGFTESQFTHLLTKTNKFFLVCRMLTSLAFSKMGLIRFDRVIRRALPLIKNKTFQDLHYPMVITGTNLTEGQPVYFKEGSLLEALRVSASVPFLFDPQLKHKNIYADGCLVEPIPVRALRQMGADIVIAVDVTQKKV